MYLWRSLLTFMWLICASVGVSHAGSVQRGLASGWNLVSVPVAQATDVATYLSENLTGSAVSKIWTFDGEWLKYVPGEDNTVALRFHQFLPNRGYWFLMSGAANLKASLSTNATPLTFNKAGWALASFNQTVSLNLASDVMDAKYFDSAHSPANISKIWSFGAGSWKKWVADGSGPLTSLEPMYSFWFYVVGGVTDASKMTISPAGSSGEAQLVIGGATTLMPPSTEVAAKLLGKKRNFAKYSSSSYQSVESFSSTSDNMSCGSASDEGKVVGYAYAYTVDGEKLNIALPAEIKCSANPTAALTYEIAFSAAEKTYLTTNPEKAKDIVVTVKLNSGQSQKAMITDEITKPDFALKKSDLSSTSALAVALIGQEMAGKMGVSPDKFKLGEANSGLEERSSKVKELVSTSTAGLVDISSLSAQFTYAATQSGSVFESMAKKIDEINDPSKLTEVGRVSDRADEIVNLVAGKSRDAKDSTFKQVADITRKIASRTGKLTVTRRNASTKGLVSTSESARLEDLSRGMLRMASSSKENIMDVADVVTKSLGMAETTSGDALLGNLTKGKFQSLIAAIPTDLSSLNSADGTTKSMEMIAKAMEFPKDVVGQMAKNENAAKAFSGIVGKATNVLQRAQSDSDTKTKLGKLTDLVSKLDSSKDLIGTLVENASSTDAVSNIVAEAVGATAGATGAAAAMMTKISEVKTKLSTSSTDIKIDFTDVISKSVGTGYDLGEMAKIMAKESGNANDAAKILSTIAGAVTTEEMGEMLEDKTLKEDFALTSKVFADAGAPKKIKFSGSTVSFMLDARNSFDPAGSALTFAWTEVGSSSVISTAALTEVKLSGLSEGRVEKLYRVDVKNAANASARAEVRVVLYKELPPIVEGPRYLIGNVNEALLLNANGSFDPDGRVLNYEWTFGGTPTIRLGSATSPVVKIEYAKEGIYDGLLKVSKSETSFATQAFKVKINGALPPLADAGFDFFVEQEQAVSGIRMENYSISAKTGTNNGLTYKWEPAAYFSRNINENASSEFPKLATTAPGQYKVTLTVFEGAAKSTDDVVVTVLKGNPPFADAGLDQVVRLGASKQIVELDGGLSFSFANSGNLTYKWTGPTSFVGSTATSAVAKVEIDPTKFTQRKVLTYTLTVTDANGTAEDKVNLVVVPSVRPPVAIVDQYPVLPTYKPGAIVDLDASFSFSPSNLTVTHNWVLPEGVELLSGSASDAIIQIKLPVVSTQTDIKIKYVVKDSASREATNELLLTVVPDIRPPQAVVNPSQVFLSDNTVWISGAESFTRGSATTLKYLWTFNTKQVKLVSGAMTDASIEIAAADGVADGLGSVKLTVTDENGMSSDATLVVKLEAKKALVVPLFVDADIERTFDPATRRFIPQFVDGSSFKNGATYGYKTPGVYVFSQQDKVKFFGFAYDQNAETVDYQVNAKLYNWDSSTEKVSGAGVLLGTKPSDSGFADFSFESSAISTSVTWMALVVDAGSEGRYTAVTIPFMVRPAVVASQPVAKPLITLVQSRSVGKVVLATDTLTKNFPDDFISFELDGSRSTNPNGGKLNYKWESEFLGTFTEKKTAPELFLTGKETSKLQFDLPLSDQVRTLAVYLTVTDEFSGTPSKKQTVIIKSGKVLRMPPVAKLAPIPKLVIPATDADGLIEVFANAFESFSPVGNKLAFKWSYFGFHDKPFASSTEKSVSGSAKVSMQLPEGVHPFELTVSDVTDTTLESSKVFFKIEIEKERVFSAIDYGVSFFVDAFPIDAQVNLDTKIVSEFYPFAIAGTDSQVDPGKMEKLMTITDPMGEIHQIPSESLASDSFVTRFANPGEYVVDVKGWYDLDGDKSHTAADKSEIAGRKFVIRVSEKIDPVLAELGVAPKVTTGAALATVPVTFVALNPNHPSGWEYTYRFELRNSLDYGVALYTVNGVPASEGVYKIVTSASVLHPNLQGLELGDYMANLEVSAQKGDVVQRAFTSSFFKVVSDKVRLNLTVLDQNRLLNWSTVTVNMFAITKTAGLDERLPLVDSANTTTKLTGISSSLFTTAAEGRYEYTVVPASAVTTAGGFADKVTGLYIEVVDSSIRNENKVAVSFFSNKKPTDGDWNIVLEKFPDQTDIEGTILKPGQFFSFAKGEIYSSYEDENGDENTNIDFVVDTGEIARYTTDSYTNEVWPIFFANSGRRIVEVSPTEFDESGNLLTAGAFFERAMSSSGNIAFDKSLFDDSQDAAMYPEKDRLYLAEYKKEDGTYNFALMHVTYADKLKFAFRFALATRTIPDIAFSGAALKDQINLSMDFSSGAWFADGGVPGTGFELITSGSKNYRLESGSFNKEFTDLYVISTTKVGSFDREGRINGLVAFSTDKLYAGDMIQITGYAYTDYNGKLREVYLPNPMTFFYREEKIGGFGLGYSVIVSSTQFKVAYFGQPSVTEVTKPENYEIKISSGFDKTLFEGMFAGTSGLESVLHENSSTDPEVNGYLVFNLKSAISDWNNTFVAIRATGKVTSVDGIVVERPRQVVTSKAIWNQIVHPADIRTKLMEVREDDYGWKSQPYLVATTLDLESGKVLREFSTWSGTKEFLAFKLENGMIYGGRGNFDPYTNQRKYLEIPQLDDYNPFTNTASKANVEYLTSGATVGSAQQFVYWNGNSYSHMGAAMEFGNDYRPRVTAHARVLRVLPTVEINGYVYSNVVEVRVVEKHQWPNGWDEQGKPSSYDDNNFEKRTTLYLYADKIGIIASNYESQWFNAESAAMGYVNQAYRQRTSLTGFNRADLPAEDPAKGHLSEGDPKLLFGDTFTGFASVDMMIRFERGEENAAYKVLAYEPSKTSVTGYVLSTSINAQLSTTYYLYDQVSFKVTNPIPSGFYRFEVYKYDSSNLSDPTPADSIVGKMEVVIDGRAGFMDLVIGLRAIDEVLPIWLGSNNGYSLLAGQFTGTDEIKRDFAYLPLRNGTGNELVLNPVLPNNNPSGRRIQEVYVEGANLKAKFNKLVNESFEVSTTGIETAGDRVDLIPGNVYLYVGPSIGTMKGTGSDKVLALIGVISKNLDGFEFVYLLKSLSTITSKVSFKGVGANVNLGYQVHEGFYRSKVLIDGWFDLKTGVNPVSFSHVGDNNAVMAYLGSTEGASFKHLNVWVSEDGSYQISAAGSKFTTISRLGSVIDFHSLPSALPMSILTRSTAITATTTFVKDGTFISTDDKGNHVLFTMRSWMDDSATAATNSTNGVKRFNLDFAYLMDGNTPADRYWVRYENELVKSNLDIEGMEHHDVMLDFNVTGKPYIEITDAKDALLKIDGDRYYGNYHVFAADPAQFEKVRGAEVFASFDLGVQSSFQLDRFDGQGHVEITKSLAVAPVSLGMLDFGGYRSGNIQFVFTDDASRHEGEQIKITKLEWVLPGAATRLTTSVDLVFEFKSNPDQVVTPQGDGIKLLGAKIIDDGQESFIDMIFNRDVDPESYKYAYLVKLNEYIDYSTGAVANTTYVQPRSFVPVEMMVNPDRNSPRIVRAWFSSEDRLAVATKTARFYLNIETDYTGISPKGIRATDGSLLNYGWLQVGNRRVMNAEYFKVHPKNVYRFDVYGNFGAVANTASTTAVVVVTNDLVIYANQDHSFNRVFRWNAADLSLEICKDFQASSCAQLWTSNSTLGSVNVLGTDTFVRFNDFVPRFWVGGMEYTNAAVFTFESVENVSGLNVVTNHEIVFVPGPGFIRHHIHKYTTPDYADMGYSMVEASGFKLFDKVDEQGKDVFIYKGNLQGLTEDANFFNGIDMEIGLSTPSDFTDPMSLVFFQNEGTIERKIGYALQDSTGILQGVTSAGLEVISGNYYKFRLDPYTETNKLGIRPANGRFNLVAKLSDSTGKVQVRNVDIETFETNRYWYLDFASQAVYGKMLHSSDYFSMLKDMFLTEDDYWDLHLLFVDGKAKLAVRSRTSTKSTTGMAIGFVEGLFHDLISQPGYTIATPSSTEVEVFPGAVVVVKISAGDRNNALGVFTSKDIYALVHVISTDPASEKLEFEYALSTEVSDDGVDFYGAVLNAKDPESGIVNPGVGAAPVRSGYVNLSAGQCADLELDFYNPATSTWDYSRPVTGCTSSSMADFAVLQSRLVEDGGIDSMGKWHGAFEVEYVFPGGAKPTGFEVYRALYRMPYALHESMLADPATAPVSVAVRVPVEMEYSENFCSVMGDYSQGFFAREHVQPEVSPNDFHAQVNIRLEAYLPYADGTASGSTGGTGGLTSIHSLSDCLSIAKVKVGVNYNYWSYQRSVDGLESLKFRGDIANTGKEHPMAPIHSYEEFLNYPIHPDEEQDLILDDWRNALTSVAPTLLSTLPNGWERGFLFNTQDLRLKGFAVESRFHAEVTTMDSFFMNVNSYGHDSYRNRNYRVTTAEMNLGVLNMSVDPGSMDPQGLWLKMNVHGNNLKSVTIDSLRLLFPYSDLGVDFDYTKTLNFFVDSGGYIPPTTGFDSAKALRFETGELDGTWFELSGSPSTSGFVHETGELSLNPNFDYTAGSGSYLDSETSESFDWAIDSDKALKIFSPEGHVYLYKAEVKEIELPLLGMRSFLVVYGRDEGQTSYHPALWFRSAEVRELILERGGLGFVFGSNEPQPQPNSGPASGQIKAAYHFKTRRDSGMSPDQVNSYLSGLPLSVSDQVLRVEFLENGFTHSAVVATPLQMVISLANPPANSVDFANYSMWTDGDIIATYVSSSDLRTYGLQEEQLAAGLEIALPNGFDVCKAYKISFTSPAQGGAIVLPTGTNCSSSPAPAPSFHLERDQELIGAYPGFNQDINFVFTKPFPQDADLSVVKPADVAALTTLGTDPMTVFGPGKFIVFKNLGFMDTMMLNSVDMSDGVTAFFQNFLPMIGNLFQQGKIHEMIPMNVVATFPMVATTDYEKLKITGLGLDTANNVYTIMFSPFLPPKEGQEPKYLRGTVSLGGQLNLLDYTLSADPRFVEAEVSHSLGSLIDPSSGTIVVPSTAPLAYLRKVESIPGFDVSTVFDVNKIYMNPMTNFASLNAENLILEWNQLDSTMPEFDLMFKLPNGALFDIANFKKGKLRGAGMFTGTDGVLHKVADMFIGTEHTLISGSGSAPEFHLGEFYRSHVVEDVRENTDPHLNYVQTAQMSDRIWQVWGLLPNMSVSVSDVTTVVTDVLVIRQSELSFPVGRTSLTATVWERITTWSPGRVQDEYIFLAKGLGPVLGMDFEHTGKAMCFDGTKDVILNEIDGDWSPVCGNSPVTWVGEWHDERTWIVTARKGFNEQLLSDIPVTTP